jgi:hypothetical protein
MATGILTKQSKSYRELWELVGLVILVIALVGLVLWLLLPSNFTVLNARSTRDPMEHISQVAFSAETGIRVVRVNIGGGGGIIKLRYQVIDPDKAVVVHDDDYPPGVIDEAGGRLLNIPLHNHNDDRKHQAGVTSTVMIKNSGGVLKPGSLVTVVVGESRLEHVPVQ